MLVARRRAARFAGVCFVLASLVWIYLDTPNVSFYHQDTYQYQEVDQSIESHGQALAGHFDITAASITNKSLIQLQQEFASYCTTSTGTCSHSVRFGKRGDGGYEVCMMDKYAPEKNNCIVYSFGVGRLWDFDDTSQKHGCEVHSFDPSIRLEDHTRAPNHQFHNMGLWHEDMINYKGWKLATLGTIIKQLGHKKKVIDVLKVDVEGAEWPFLHQFISTTWPQQFKQLIFEIHTPTRRKTNMTASEYNAVLLDLESLQKQHGYRLYKNSHANNCCGRFATLTPEGLVSPHRRLCCYELYYINPQYKRP